MPNTIAKSGPVIAEAITEVQGIFPNDAALQDAVGRLTRLGFDRAALSLPAAQPEPGRATPEAGAADPNTEDDARQLRTLGSSTAAVVGAAVGAGLTVASGGAALPALAAAAGLGLASGGSAFATASAATEAQRETRANAAAAGELVLAVTLRRGEEPGKAEAAMREAGATRTAAVIREGAGISSASWTGRR